MSAAEPPAARSPWPAPPDPPELPAGVTPTPGRPRWKPQHAPLAFVAGLAGALVGGLLIAALGAVFGASATDPPPAVTISATVLQDVAFILAAIFFARLSGSVAPWQFGLRPTKLWRAAGLVALAYVGFLLFSAGYAAIFSIDEQSDLPESLGVDKSDIALAASAVLVCVMAPLAEEFFFRGFIFSALRNWKGLWPAVVLDGLIFGAIHAGGTPVAYLVPLALLGAVLCLLYWRTGSLWPPIALHCLNNSVAFGYGVDWSWQIPLLFFGALGVIYAVARAVEARFGPAPAFPAPV